MKSMNFFTKRRFNYIDAITIVTVMSLTPDFGLIAGITMAWTGAVISIFAENYWGN